MSASRRQDHTLRRAGPDEAELLTRLWRTTFEQAYREKHAPRDIAAYCAANMKIEQAQTVLSDGLHVCTLGLRGSAATGYATVKNHACPVALDGASAELKQLYVLPSEFGAGMARALLEDVFETVRSWGASYVWLAVADSNTRAQAFYRKHGFAPVGAGPTFEVGAEAVSSTLMARRVEPY
jgi:ribosomal protein S18 acetylase RimI-like enzyme